VAVIRVSGKADAAQHGGRRLPGRQDSDAVEALLPVPVAVIAGGADVLDRKGLVGALDLLEAERVRLLLGEIFDEPRQPGADAVQIVGNDLHRVAA
jgi:hypothetical protein